MIKRSMIPSLIILLQGGQILPGLHELPFFHGLLDVGIYEGSLGKEDVELVVVEA